MLKHIAVFGLALLLGASPATAQERGSADTQLLELSKVLGSLHHLVPICKPNTGELWRDRMMELIRLERPSTAQKNAMVEAFNASFTATARMYPRCTIEAEQESQAKARKGEALAGSLSARIK